MAKHDFDAEPVAIKSELINIFGLSNWKQKTSEYMSWQGLQNTPEFASWNIQNTPPPQYPNITWENITDKFVGLFPTTNTNCN